jgi:hypothetical protein
MARRGVWADWLPPAPRPLDVLLLTGNQPWSAADDGNGRQCDSIHRGPLPRETLCMCGRCHATGEQAEYLAYLHGEPIDSRPNPDYRATATTYDPGTLKGGRG